MSMPENTQRERRRRFVSRQEFSMMSRTAPDVSLDAFRADQEAVDADADSVYTQPQVPDETADREM
jgi:hypothetical protein